MKRYILISIFFFFSAFSGRSQMPVLLPKYYKPLDSAVLSKNEEKKKSNYLLQKNYFTYGVNIGTGYSSFSGSASMLNTYIAPHFTYNVTERFQLNVGAVYMSGNFNGAESLMISGNQNTISQSTESYGASLSGNYRFSENFTIYGSGSYYKMQVPFRDENGSYNREMTDLSLGLHYKVSDNFKFDAFFRYTDGLNPYYNSYDPMYSNWMYQGSSNRYSNPFYW